MRAWFAFALGCACFGYAFVQRVAPSVMTDDLMRAFQVQAGALGALSAFYFYAYAGMQMPIGMLMDRFGVRRMLSGAMALCLVGSMVFAYADGLTVASIGRMLIGAAVAFAYVGTMSIAAFWFPQRQFSLLTGILQTVGMLGAIAGQAPLVPVVTEFGWRDTVIGIGVLGAVLAVLIFLVVEEIPAEKKAAAKSAAKGAMRDVLARKDSWCCALIGFSLTAPMLAFAGLWAVPWLVQVQGLPKDEAGATASLIFLGWAIFCPMIGWLTERIGRRKPLIYVGILLGAGSLASLILIEDLPIWALRILCVLNGIGGCTMILSFACVREVNRPNRAGAGLGFVNMFVVGSGALFQPLLGFLLDASWDGTMQDGAPVYSADSYVFAFSALLVGYAIGFVATVFLRETYCRQVVEG